MSAQGWVTAPPDGTARAVTNSLRTDVPLQNVGFFSEDPPGNRPVRHRTVTQRIFFDPAISLSSLLSSGLPS
jgi:hypothetical protein